MNGLPTPDSDALTLSNELTQYIRRRIQRHGNPSFANFMQMALYTPSLGYYANGLPKIGAGGDFTTAPEISPIFSKCLANQAWQVLNQMNDGHILEFGAGRGTMAKDILLHLADHADQFNHYYILEVSAALRAQQTETLSSLPEKLRNKVIWLDQLPKQPFNGVILANEVLDAMPVERIRLEPDQQLQAFVSWDDAQQHFSWAYQPITDTRLQKIANRLQQAIGEPPIRGYHAEINLNIQPWLRSLDELLNQGMLLLIDYGYPRKELWQPARYMGTLRCHYQQRAHNNPFWHPGLQDITAHVDFTAVAEAAYAAHFKVAGYTTQAHFLMGTGLLEFSLQQDQDVVVQLQLSQQIKRLTLPDEMGESFKVMALTKQFDSPLIGFQQRDLRHQL
ncbi:class I SAM-dependent methyltransferase [Thiomicrospira aerophila]|nr:SAM-dependent methyltransferase [Thiomicrospira aerophila]